MNNKQARNNYINEAIKQVNANKILQQVQELLTHTQTNAYTDEDRQTLYHLDAQLTEILLSSEKKCSTCSINRDPWSPNLKEKGKAVVY